MTRPAPRIIMIAAIIVAITLVIWRVTPRTRAPVPRDGAIRIVAAKERAGPPVNGPIGASPVAAPDDRRARTIPDGGEDPYTLGRSLRAEPRDPAWAPMAEAASRVAFAGLPYVGTAGNPVTARCGRSLCEIGGRLPAGLGVASMTVATDGLQGGDLGERLARIGLEIRGVGFQASPDGDTFVVHARRR